MIRFRMKEKLALTAEVHGVKIVQLAMTEFRIKAKLKKTAEVHVNHVLLAMTKLRIKEK